jgi:hypothetical protein
VIRIPAGGQAGTREPSSAATPDAVAGSHSPALAANAPTSRPQVRSVTIDGEITYGAFARMHGSDVSRLNALNGLDFDNSTLLARGSELYIPAQP